jgi:4a-hydroxytetrahydrobiopterin dehydratase
VLHVCREVEVNIQTHVAGGITMNDFVLAAQLDQLDVEYSPKWLQSQQVPVQQAAAKQ